MAPSPVPQRYAAPSAHTGSDDHVDRAGVVPLRQGAAHVYQPDPQAITDQRPDPARVGQQAAKLAAERDALLEQLRAATGLGGRPRVAGSSHERARIAVRKAIVKAIDRVAAADLSLGRLLSDTVTTGAICRYDPDPDRPVHWVLSAR